MKILVLRTDRPKAEVGIYDNETNLVYQKWEAHLRLAETIHLKLKDILDLLSISLDELEGIVVFKGPGSFTGLRIGISVANALASANSIPIIGSTTEDWISAGLKRLLEGKNDLVVVPEYGAAVRTTTQKK